MTPEQVLMAIEHYGLTLFSPGATKVRPGAEWVARSNDGRRMGFGANPTEAVMAAVPVKDGKWC